MTAAPFALPFLAPSGSVQAPLSPPSEEFADYDTRQLRLLLAVLEPLLPAISRCISRVGKTRIGLVLGSTNAGLDQTERLYARYVREGQTPTEFRLHAQHSFVAAMQVVQSVTGIAGPMHTVSTACSSSGKAFASAVRLIAAGLADAVLVGGVDALCEMTLRGFASLAVLAQTPCQPFGAARDGINIGEGAALFLLQREIDAPLFLAAAGESADAYHMTAPDPLGEGAERAMRQALVDANLDASEIDLVNAHATGTTQGDAAEASALSRVFGRDTPVLSTKGYTGHALGAAGAIEAALSLISLEKGFAPASLGSDPVDSALGISVVHERREGNYQRVLSNSFAFGGSNVSLIFGRAA